MSSTSSARSTNIIHFVFDRDTPVWLEVNFHEHWNLPKVDQGTGMDPAIAYALRFPAPEEFDEYIQKVQAAVVPRIENISDEYLQTFMTIRPWGSVSPRGSWASATRPGPPPRRYDSGPFRGP